MRKPILLSILLAAASAHAETPKACDLVSTTQAQTVLEGKAAEAKELDAGKCSFTDPDVSRGLIISITPVANPDQMKKTMWQPAPAGHTKQYISGLGDLAYYRTNSADGDASVSVLYHGYLIGVDITSPAKVPRLRATLIALAKQITEKI